MNNSPSAEIIVQKTEEFDKLPGLLLGLDGWVLRSIPQEYRRQFLTGYEKLLRVALHPDRCQGDDRKRGREAYLQAVAEAVAFMCRDEFSFELASDTVPTKRNPFVMMQSKIDLQEGIISRIHETLEETRGKLSGAVESEQSIRSKVTSVIEGVNQESEIQFRLRAAMNRLVNSFPVPLACEVHQVQGSFLDLDLIQNCGSLIERLDPYTNGKADCGQGEWFIKREYQTAFLPALRPGRTFSFRRKSSVNEDYSIVGAMTLPHLCEYIRAQREGVLQPDDAGRQIRQALARLCLFCSAYQRQHNELAVLPVVKYLVPFYTAGSFLLLQKLGPKDKPTSPTDSAPDGGLFLVNESDYATAPNAAIVSGLKEDVRKARLSEMRQRKEARAAKDERRDANIELKELRAKLRHAEAQIIALSPLKTKT